VIAATWADHPIVLIDRLGIGYLASVNTGDAIPMPGDGNVRVVLRSTGNRASLFLMS
jgi:hypothetical protein